MSALVHIALGGNVGDSVHIFRRAIGRLTRRGQLHLQCVSSLYDTSPVGGPAGQPNFVNAVLRADTSLGPHELLAVLLDCERQHDRRRDVSCGPRTLDLDLLFHDERIIADESLILPHPRLHHRLFVLQPLAEISPDLRHPVLDLPISTLLGRLSDTDEVICRRCAPSWLTENQSSPLIAGRHT